MKDKSEMKTASSSPSSDNLKMSEEDELLNRKLIKFQDKVDSIIEDEQFHSSWNLSSDSAMWYVRSYINAAYSCDHTQTETDAAEEIEQFLNLYVPPHYYFPPAPSGYHYINVADPDNPFILLGYEYLNPDDPNPGDNEEDYLIYYCSNQNGNITWNNKCLDVNELNFYYYGERRVICDILPEELNKPDDWIFIFSDLEGTNYGPDVETNHKNGLYFARHLLVENTVWLLEFD